MDGAEPHHLLLGVAILVGDHYMRVGSVEAKDVAAGPDGVTLKARVLEGAEESGDIVRLEIAPETPR